MSKVKLNKVEVKVSKVETVKVDKRKNNPGRPVNKKSARYIRLQKQAFYADVNSKFKKGNQFKIGSNVYKYVAGKNDSLGCIVGLPFEMHECNVEYVGRTKVKGYAFVLGKKVNVELNLKTLKFSK
jgi:4-hydroxy-3-methylbut-2-en-1-yl diphosphate synthase IspG/GcpE